MSVDEGDIFKNVATAGQKLLLQFQALANAGSGAVLSPATENGGASSRRTATADMMLALAEHQHEEFVRHLNEQLNGMDEANVRALQNIEEELAALRRERERVWDQAYKDDRGIAIFMKADESAAFYEDGTELDDDTFAAIKDQLRGKPTEEAWTDFVVTENALVTAADQIHARQDQQDRLRADAAAGRISDEEAAGRFQALQAADDEFAQATIRKDGKISEMPAAPPRPFQF